MELEAADQQALDDVLNQWHWAKEEHAVMAKKIEECKGKVEKEMLRLGSTEITTANFKVEKRTQSRESIAKKDVPENVWGQCANTSTFTVLSLTDLTSKHLKAAKAKAKAKGKAKDSPTAKAKPVKKGGS